MIDVRPDSVQQRFAAVVAMVLVLITLAVQHNPQLQFAPRPWIGVGYGVGVGVLDLLAALILIFRQPSYPRRSSSILIAMSVATGALILGYGVLLPGALGVAHPFGTTIYAATWLWVPAHALWAASMLVYGRETDRERRGNPALPLPWQASVTIGALAAIVVIVVVLMRDRVGPLPVSTNGPLQAVLVLQLVATLVLVIFTRARTLGHLWLIVAGFSGTCDLLLSLEAKHRYTASWFAAKGAGLTEALLFVVALTVQSWPLLWPRRE